ncbi:hypothetical protein QA648_27335 (plasmid) [Rhizobium sp. CB3171]|uniref:hypothetical protein n=1 Tax=Rhizobium sp. CB3171 TaxID=3039157 RepID=UPI0024B1869A|nr:hypothetical protein [Rhizobium sp. CB3171]WFU04498.1 hypothetical protein QA648_27335 [Rhizobium sp. CB3171]
MSGALDAEAVSYSPRVATFRASMIAQIPRAPRNRVSLALLQSMPTRELIFRFVTWRMRLVTAKPRTVTLWAGGVTQAQLQDLLPELQPLLEGVERGEDLTPYLSNLVENKGVILPGANPSDKGKDLDSILIRNGLHHFHVGAAGPGNRVERSNRLIFAEVLEAEFRIVAISDHGAFVQGSPEQQRFFSISRSYVEKDMAPDSFYMMNPVMSSGHSMVVTMFGLQCEKEIERLDPLLDDAEFVDSLYNGQPIFRGDTQIFRPRNPKFSWHFDNLKLGILDRKTKVFFCIFPFFDR